MEVTTTLGSILKFPLRPFIPFLSFRSTRGTVAGLTLEDAQLVTIGPNGGLVKENNGLEMSHLVEKSHRKSLRVGIPTREIGDVVGKVRGRSRKVERNVEGQKEFGSGRMDGWMEMALKAKRLSPGRRFADFQRRHLRWRAFCTGFAFGFLSSREARDSGEVGDGNLGFRLRGDGFLVNGHFLSRGIRSCVKKGWEK
jgi:hypothetical protein